MDNIVVDHGKLRQTDTGTLLCPICGREIEFDHENKYHSINPGDPNASHYGFTVGRDTFGNHLQGNFDNFDQRKK